MIVFVASPTGGHIYPAIALAQELSEHPCHFVSAKQPTGSTLIERYGFTCSNLPKFRKNPFLLVWAFLKSVTLLLQLKPTVVVLFGGYTCIPVGFTAWLLRIPILVLEQNVLPGRANRFLARFAQTVYVSFKESLQYISHPNIKITGNPVRAHFLDDAAASAFKKESFASGPVIGIFGGSQGAQALNTWIATHYTQFLETPNTLIHITGIRHYNQFVTGHNGEGQHPLAQDIGACQHKEGYTVIYNEKQEVKLLILPYLERMDLFYKACSLVVCRAGASTVSELLYFNVPSVLVPYPFAKDQHQVANAKAVEALGMGTCLLEPDLDMPPILTALTRKYVEQDTLHTARDKISKDINSLFKI